jgi:hypothetical protein
VKFSDCELTFIVDGPLSQALGGALKGQGTHCFTKLYKNFISIISKNGRYLNITNPSPNNATPSSCHFILRISHFLSFHDRLTMTSTPQHLDYSIPPSPVFPPVPRVSPASSASSLHSLYDLDGQRLQASFQYSDTSFHEYDGRTLSPHERVLTMSKSTGFMFTDDDLAKAFNDRSTGDSNLSPNRGSLAHDASNHSSPWKRSIRVRYSDLNMRDSNTLALQEASDLLSRDMASYVPSSLFLV